MIGDNFIYKKIVYPKRKNTICPYEFVDYDGKVLWKHHRFYLFWGDEEIKKILDCNSEFVSNFITSKGRITYVSFSKIIPRRCLIFLYNVLALTGYNWTPKEIQERYHLEKASEFFQMVRSVFLPLGIDVAKCKTQSQIASDLYRFGFLVKPIFPPAYPIRRMALKSTVGDFKQVYKIGDWRGKFRLYDGKAFYPHCILAIRSFPEVDSWFEVESTEEFLDSRNIGGFAKVYFLNRTDYHLVGKKTRPITYSEKGSGIVTLAELRAFKTTVDFDFIKGWAYRKGNQTLYDYQSFLLELREKYKDDPVIFSIIKNIQNFIVGKFLQRSERLPVATIRKLCSRKELPFSMVISSSLLETEKKYATIGGLYYPEWYSLITGYGRSIEAQAVLETEPFIALSDAVITEKNKGKNFWISSQEYRVKGQSDRLIVLNKHNYILEGIKANRCGYSKALNFENLKQIFLKKLEKKT